jgi:hypothetical protein
MCFGSKTKTSYGCKIDRRKIPGLPSDLNHESALGVFISACSGVFYESKVREVIRDFTIEWWNDIAPSPSTGLLNTVVVWNGQVFSGLSLPGNVCRVAWRGKIHRSAFSHELVHMVAERILGDGDADHKNPDLWAIEARSTASLVMLDL